MFARATDASNLVGHLLHVGTRGIPLAIEADNHRARNDVTYTPSNRKLRLDRDFLGLDTRGKHSVRLSSSRFTSVVYYLRRGGYICLVC